MKTIDVVLRQNAKLEKEVNRLIEELNEATEGILKRGYLYMWRDRAISYASRWGSAAQVHYPRCCIYWNQSLLE